MVYLLYNINFIRSMQFRQWISEHCGMKCELDNYVNMRIDTNARKLDLDEALPIRQSGFAILHQTHDTWYVPDAFEMAVQHVYCGKILCTHETFDCIMTWSDFGDGKRRAK